MAISLYNTLTRKVEEFVPLEEGKVSMYTCGPTVYDYFHIGNARSFVMSDVIRRYFQYRGYEVRYVMNITDIDDKIINKANAEGQTSGAIAENFAAAFLEDAGRFGIRPADVFPRATETIDDIIAHIQGLIDAGAAYVVDGDVFFAVDAFPEYGKLSGKKVEDLQIGARVEADTRKRNPVDFALWKSAKPGEPWWEAPWGKGRPGWHIECSVMSQKYLGETFDIHAGGNDLIFPHHENEIAQSEALTHRTFARYWLHFGFLNIDNEKMSKSLGNFFTARDVLDRYQAESMRFFYLQTHYRGPLNFSQEGVEAAVKGLQKLQGLYRALQAGGPGNGTFDVSPYENRFIEAMDADFNTPAAFGVLFELVRDVNAQLRETAGLSDRAAEGVLSFLRATAGDVFGVLSDREDAVSDENFSAVMDLLLDVREMARAEKQWAMADLIRNRLGELGITIEDGKDGSSWKMGR
jgi:cysteinyl-tRNA synthetase